MKAVCLRDERMGTMCAEWKALQSRPPIEREKFLKSQTTITVMGAAWCRRHYRPIKREYDRLRTVAPSEPWMEAWRCSGERMPARQMMLGRAEVRFGDEPAHRRYTPRPAVEVEDALDELTPHAAAMYSYPASPSAVAIERVQMFGTAGARRFARGIR